MNLLGQRVKDSVTGILGTVIGQAQYLHDNEVAMVAYGEGFDTAWLAVGRLTVEATAGVGKSDPAKAAPKPATTKGPATNGAAAPAAPVQEPPGPAINHSAPAAAETAPGPNPVTVAVETYAKVAAAFIVLGKAGQSATIQAILKSHNAAHAKQISDNAPALADVLAQAQAAIAALPSA